MKKFISLLFLCVLGNTLLAVTESVSGVYSDSNSNLAYDAFTTIELSSATTGETVTSASTYLVIDLSGGTSATSYPVTTLAAPPEGGWTDEYKTTKLVLRVIEAGSFKMSGSYDVTISKPFCMGVFEVTQKQYQLVMGSNPSSYTGDARPVETISWNTIRGDSSTYNWPSNQTVDANSFMGKLRAKTGLDIDLPTEAQWEYTCRAGTTSSYNNGGDSEADLKTLGRYSGNQSDGRGGCPEHTKVGSYLPNAWGLYDMHGNVWEWCLDWYSDLTSSTNPVGPSSGLYRVKRGGSCYNNADACASSYRYRDTPLYEYSNFGFRLACPASSSSLNSVTVTFDANGGEGGISVTQDYGSRLSAPTVTREGYTFIGWSPSVPATVPATDITYVAQWQEMTNVDYLTYKIENNQVTITGCSQDVTGAVILPTMIEGYPVVEIGKNAFYECTGLTSIVIPMGVISIGVDAFFRCANLESVSIPDSLTFLGDGVLFGCEKLPMDENGIRYESDARKILVSVPQTLSGVFTVPSTVRFICNAAINGTALTSIIFPEGVTFIGWDSLRANHSLTTIQLPSTLTYIGDHAFSSCPLTTITFAGPPPTVDGYLYAYTNPIGYYSAKYATEWQAVIESDGTWQGLRMQLLEGDTKATITFDANGGEGGTSVTLDYGSALSAPTVTREGYTFTGWLPSVPATAPATDTTYVAQWQANVYIIAYSANGGSGTMEATAATYDVPETIVNNAFVRDGYRFMGWATTAEGEVLYTSGESVSNLTAVQNGVVTLYAIWEEIPNTPEGPGGDEPSTPTSPNWSVGNYQYNMVVYASVQNAQGVSLEADGNLLAAFDVNGICRGAVGPLDIGIGVKVYQLTVCSDNSTESGLTLKLWDAATNTIHDVNGTINFAADTEVGLLWDPVIYTTIEVEQPEPTTITVTFDANGGNGGTSVTLDHGSALSAPTVMREGYTFVGWTPSVPATVPATNTTYVAQWQANVYTITYSANGGLGTMEAISAMYGTPVVIATNAFVRDGYCFVGWATAAEGEVLYTSGESVSNLTAVQNGVVTLYAIWEEISNTPEGPGGDEPSTPTSPNWSVGNYQYNMVVYASIQNAQGVSLEADDNLLAAFDANGVCRGVVGPLDIDIGVKVYQLTVCSDNSTESGLTLKLWNAASNTIYDVNGTINFAADTEVGLLWDPIVYTVAETTVKYDVITMVVGEGIVMGAGSYELGEAVTLTATPDEGYVFCGWSTTPITSTATYTFTMPEASVNVTAYFAPLVALNNYVVVQDFVAEDAVNTKIQEYVEENNLKTPEEVEAAIDAHVAENGLLTPAEANQQTQDYIADNKLMSKDEAKQELLDDDEVFTEDEMKALALGAPVIKVKDGVATVSIQVQKASELNGEWGVVEDGEVSVEITPKAGEKAGFYKFVVPNKQ